MVKKKDKRTHNDLQNITQKTEDWSTGTPIKTRVNCKVSSYCFTNDVWHSSYYSSNKLRDKSWMRKEPYLDYNKRNISEVICDVTVNQVNQVIVFISLFTNVSILP